MTMRPIHLRFEPARASRAARARTWLQGAGGSPLARAGLVALLAAAVLAADMAWQARQALADQDALAQRLETAQARSRRPAPPPGPPRTDTAAGALAVQLLNLPWSALLDTLEQSLPPEVALVSIEPDSRQGRVRLQAEARDLDTLLAYSRALAEAPGVAEALPLQHETLEQDPARPVRLVLQARLAPTDGAAPVQAPR